MGVSLRWNCRSKDEPLNPYGTHSLQPVEAKMAQEQMPEVAGQRQDPIGARVS